MNSKRWRRPSNRVGFSASGFASQYYKGDISLSDATLVEVMTSVVPNIDAELEEVGGGSVTGRVTNASNGQGAVGVEVCAEEEPRRCVETNGDGEYTISGLSVGSDTIFLLAGGNLRRRTGEKIRCQPKSDYLNQSVFGGREVGQTATAQRDARVGGQISGTVTNA